MADGLLEAVRLLRLADPGLGPKPLLAKLRELQPDLAAGNKEVREALIVLKVPRPAALAGCAVGGRDRDRAGDQEERELLLESAQRALATLAPSSPMGRVSSGRMWVK